MSERELIVRVVVVKDDKILLCKSLEKNFYFLPGGHIEQGESPETALERELAEEIGKKPKKIKKVTEVNNIYTRENGAVIEKFYIYLAILDNYENIVSKESHIAFDWIPVGNLEKIDLKPKKALPNVIKSIEENKEFFGILF